MAMAWIRPGLGYTRDSDPSETGIRPGLGHVRDSDTSGTRIRPGLGHFRDSDAGVTPPDVSARTGDALRIPARAPGVPRPARPAAAAAAQAQPLMHALRTPGGLV